MHHSEKCIEKCERTNYCECKTFYHLYTLATVVAKKILVMEIVGNLDPAIALLVDIIVWVLSSLISKPVGIDCWAILECFQEMT